jgi:hypothetical protein
MKMMHLLLRLFVLLACSNEIAAAAVVDPDELTAEIVSCSG